MARLSRPRAWCCLSCRCRSPFKTCPTLSKCPRCCMLMLLLHTFWTLQAAVALPIHTSLSAATAGLTLQVLSFLHVLANAGGHPLCPSLTASCMPKKAF